jgi:hypothetical protein
MKIKAIEDGKVLIEASGKVVVDEESGLDSVVYPDPKEIGDGRIFLTLSPVEARAVADAAAGGFDQFWRDVDGCHFKSSGHGARLLATHFGNVLHAFHPDNYLFMDFDGAHGPVRVSIHRKDGKTAHELMEEANAKARFSKLELEYARRRIDELCNQIASIEKQIVSTPGQREDDAWIQTYMGRAFWPLDPKVEEIDIVEIAHALSNTCRFGGHTSTFYSVAQHSVMVSRIVPPADAKWGLLHDAAEAYIGDMLRPLKHNPTGRHFRGIEARIMRCVCDCFDLPYRQPESVSDADLRLLATEKRDLMAQAPQSWKLAAEPIPQEITPWVPRVAKENFLNRADELGIEVP